MTIVVESWVVTAISFLVGFLCAAGLLCIAGIAAIARDDYDARVDTREEQWMKRE